MSDERFAQYLAHKFFAPGYDREDMAQEARIAMWQAPEGIERLCARRRLIEIVRRSQRGGRPAFCELHDIEDAADVVDLVSARDRLRDVLAASLTDLERTAVGRTLRGELCRHPYDNALYRARRKLAA